MSLKEKTAEAKFIEMTGGPEGDGGSLVVVVLYVVVILGVT